MKSKKGFTLIELLAVIVILAIIALIATPIVLDIINDTRNSSQLRSADFYLDAVEYAVSQSMTNNKVVENGTYIIMEDGNICLKYESDKVTCKDILKVDVSGEAPDKGSSITIIGSQITNTNLIYEQNQIMINSKGELDYFETKYKIGDSVTFNPGDQDRTWNVIDEDIDSVTLMLNENLGDKIAWYSSARDNSYGPITALNYLNTLTITWTNVDPIDNYVYINNKDGEEVSYGYQKMEVKNGTTILTSQTGEKNQVVGETKARLITFEEVMKLGQLFNENLKEENLRAYIERNLASLNLVATSQGFSAASTVDEAMAIFLAMAPYAINESKYFQTYNFVNTAITNFNIETTYNIHLPEIITQNLDSGYLTLSSSTTLGNTVSKTIYRDGEEIIIHNLYVNDSYRRVRPVITIPKTKLKG